MDDIKLIYESILNDEQIIQLYNQIEGNEKNDGGYAFHNWAHVRNVEKIVEKILLDLHYDNEIIYSAKIACILHDTGALEGKDGHAMRSAQFAREYFKEHNISFNKIEEVIDAIENHSDGFDTDNMIRLALILADKLDVKRNRITEAGKNVIGNRQYSHINDIITLIQDGKFEINFITDDEFNLKEACEYYFTVKIFKVIKSFSEKNNLIYTIKFNDVIFN